MPVAAFSVSGAHSFAAENTLESYHMPLETEPHLRTFMQWPVSVEIWDIATEDLWCRDSCPPFVNGARGQFAISHIQFNG
jgi:agmatine/peptidylarginine deiminase